MTQYQKIRERHIRRFFFCVFPLLFLFINWGNSAEGIYHIVLSGRASFLQTVDDELARAIEASTLPFGKSATYLVMVAIFWLGMMKALKATNWDATFAPNERSDLRKENAKYREDLSISNMALKELYATISKATENTALLSQQQNRIIEVSFELKKLLSATQATTSATNKREGTIVEDLFSSPPPKKVQSKKKRRSRRRRPEPKFK